MCVHRLEYVKSYKFERVTEEKPEHFKLVVINPREDLELDVSDLSSVDTFEDIDEAQNDSQFCHDENNLLIKKNPSLEILMVELEKINAQNNLTVPRQQLHGRTKIEPEFIDIEELQRSHDYWCNKQVLEARKGGHGEN